jgi:hypothetical protein
MGIRLMKIGRGKGKSLVLAKNSAPKGEKMINKSGKRLVLNRKSALKLLFRRR